MLRAVPPPLPKTCCAWLAGDTWLFSEPQIGTDTLFDLEQLNWPPLQTPAAGLDIAATVGGNICMSLPAGPIILLTTALEGLCTQWICVSDRIGSCFVRATEATGERTPVRWVLSMICVLAAGCSMPTTALPTASSLAHEPIGGGILRIAVPKSGLADCASADECTLVKAAEVTQRVGGTHFTVLPGHSSTTQGGYAYIKVFTFGAGERAPSTAMPVDEALYFLRKPQGQAAS